MNYCTEKDESMSDGQCGMEALPGKELCRAHDYLKQQSYMKGLEKTIQTLSREKHELEQRLAVVMKELEVNLKKYHDCEQDLGERLAEAEKVIEFYAEMKHAYDEKLSHADCDPWQFDGEGGTKMMFGQRAREYRKKYAR